MVDMTHYCYNRCSRHSRSVIGDLVTGNQSFGIMKIRSSRVMTHFLHYENRGVLIKDLINGHHAAHFHQNTDYFCRFDRHRLREFSDRNRFRHRNVKGYGFCRLFKSMLTRGGRRNSSRLDCRPRLATPSFALGKMQFTFRFSAVLALALFAFFFSPAGRFCIFRRGRYRLDLLIRRDLRRWRLSNFSRSSRFRLSSNSFCLFLSLSGRFLFSQTSLLG